MKITDPGRVIAMPLLVGLLILNARAAGPV